MHILLKNSKLLPFVINVYFMDKIDSPLTIHQVNILKAYGFSEEEIANIDLQTIRDTLRNGTIVDSSWFGDEPKYGTNDIPSHLEKIIASKNLSDRQMKGLRQRGYTYEEIAEMDIETIESILSLSHY